MIRSIVAAIGVMVAGQAVAQTAPAVTYQAQDYTVDLGVGYTGAPLPDYSDAEFLSGAAGFVCRPAEGGEGTYWSGGAVGPAYGGGAYVPAPVTPGYIPPPPPVYDDGGIGFGLVGTTWRVVAIDGRSVTAEQTLTFSSATGFSGRAACNRYSGTLTTGANLSISFSNIIATRAACPALSEEQAYLGALGRAASYRIGREGDGLALLDYSGATIVQFVPAGAAPQPGIDVSGNWRVIGIQTDTGFENMDPLLASLSFSFDGNDRFRSNGGCNDFLGSYTQNGNALQFGAVAVTARQCFAPSPFEDDMGRNLPLVRGVRGGGGQIDLVDSGGEPLFALSR